MHILVLMHIATASTHVGMACIKMACYQERSSVHTVNNGSYQGKRSYVEEFYFVREKLLNFEKALNFED